MSRDLPQSTSAWGAGTSCPAAPPAVVPTAVLLRAGGLLTVLAGALRAVASVAGEHGGATEALYLVIDVALLFGLVALYAGDPTSRTRLGTAGFALALVGLGLLIGPDDTDASIDLYAVGATLVGLGFAALAVGWCRSAVVSGWARVAFFAAVPLGSLGSVAPPLFVLSGFAFAFGLVSVGVRLATSNRP